MSSIFQILPITDSTMNQLDKVIDEQNAYYGKVYKWTRKATRRALELDIMSIRGAPNRRRIADILNKEFPQPVLLTEDAVTAKIWRMRGNRSIPSRKPRQSVR
jgi:hypothetical protein